MFFTLAKMFSFFKNNLKTGITHAYVSCIHVFYYCYYFFDYSYFFSTSGFMQIPRHKLKSWTSVSDNQSVSTFTLSAANWRAACHEPIRLKGVILIDVNGSFSFISRGLVFVNSWNLGLISTVSPSCKTHSHLCSELKRKTDPSS